MRGIGDRAGEIERLLALLGDDRRGNGDVVLAGAYAGQNSGPWQDLLLDLEWRVLLKILDQFIVKAGRLSVLDELEGTKVILGRNDQAAFLDLIHAPGLDFSHQHRNGELGSDEAEQ